MTAPAMTDAQDTSQDTSAACEVGYGKPPRHTQFRRGQSGNPGGRPRCLPVERANALLLAEESVATLDLNLAPMAPDPAPPPENGTAPPVTAAPAAPRVPSALRRSASPPSRRRTPALAGSRRGRRHAVTTEHATGSGPAAREGDRMPRENSRSAENSGKIPC